jgi:hypothetical protein
MKTLSLVVSLLLIVALGTEVLAGSDRLQRAMADPTPVPPSSEAPGKVLGDTIYLIGNPWNPDHVSDGGIGPVANGTFEDQFGNPGWFGWTHVDETAPDESYWQVSSFQAIEGNYSMWCGTEFPDGDHGYGNGWNQSLVFTHQVADNAVSTSVNLTLTVRVDTEPGYDYVLIEYFAGGIWMSWNDGGWDGVATHEFDETVVFQPGDYGGIGDDEIRLRIRFSSDAGWSDEDGLWDTDGACQADQLVVVIDGAVVDQEDFEDQVSDHWIPVLDPGVGDFATLYTNLLDEDDCRSNLSAQVAFVDNGIVVPGTGGSPCVTWCYGPGGYIVNNTGGLMGPDYHLENTIISPPVEWPDGAEGAFIGFTVYCHEELGDQSTWPGIFYSWHVRSVTTGDPADLESAPWRNDNFVSYFPDPIYFNVTQDVTARLEPGRTHVQMALRVIELGYAWGYVGTDGTPAPYFDNAKLAAYPFSGPGTRYRAIDLFNDGFPASGDLDFADLATNNVRLDMAANISLPEHLRNDPGDSIIVDAVPVRDGSVLDGVPRLHVRMKANPLFNVARTLPASFGRTDGYFPDGWSLVEGWIDADSTYNANGNLIEDRYNFDLPDTGFFFPGDVLHYYIEARDNVGGDVGTSLIPADTTGFATLAPGLHYDPTFKVRALPTVFSATPGDQPQILYWDDNSFWTNQNEWHVALSQLGYQRGVDYDLYATNGAGSGVGNGLGGRATSATLDGYDTLLYTASFSGVGLLSNGDFQQDPSRDLQVLSNWFARGGKNAFMTGDNLVSAVLDEGSLGAAFVNTYFGVTYHQSDLRGLIGGQVAPRVTTIPGNGVIARVSEWIAYGGCLHLNTFDAIEASAEAVRLAEFADATYPYAAAVYRHYEPEDAEVVLLPYDLEFLYNAPGWAPPAGYDGIAARAIVLEDILNFFGYQSSGVPIAAAPDLPLSIRCHPNPFNPMTTIQLTVPRPGDVTLRIYDLRGRLVRTLVAGELLAGGHEVTWDGRNEQGGTVASGVYVAEARAGGATEVQKLTLVR